MQRSPLWAGLAALACAAVPASASATAWTEIPSGTTQNITAVEYQSPTRFWFTTAAGAIYTRRADGSFIASRAASGSPLNDIEFQKNGPIGLAVGNGGQVLRSTDAGATWSPVTGITASSSDLFGDCATTGHPLGDLNAVRFAGDDRAWVLGTGAQMVKSQGAWVGASGTWVDANRDPSGRCKVPSGYGYADAFFVPSDPTTGYFLYGHNFNVAFSSDDLGDTAQLKAGGTRAAFGVGRVLAGDPANPSRLWAVGASPGGLEATAYTRDGFQTDARWQLGNPTARVFPTTGPADVAYAGGTVLAAGDAGLILNSTDGQTFYYSSADGTLATERWNAVALADAADGAVGGDGGHLAITTQANTIPPAATPTPPPTPVAPAPPIAPTRAPLRRHPKLVITAATAKGYRRITVDVRGRLVAPVPNACHGTVVVTVEHGHAPARHSVGRLTSACTYHRVLTLTDRRTHMLDLAVRFGGNAYLFPAHRERRMRVKH